MFVAIFVLFAVREVELSASMVGMAFSMVGIGFFVGSLCVKQLSRALGLGPAMLAGLLATALGWGLISLVHGPGHQAVATLIFGLICEVGAGLFFLTYVSLRQGITPEPLLGRVISTLRFVAIAATSLKRSFNGAINPLLSVVL